MSSTRPEMQLEQGQHTGPLNPNESGFSLIEMIVGLAIFAQVLVAAFVLFDVNTRVSRVQTEVAELQQSQRIANYDLLRTTRMAGRGGLNANVAVGVQNNVNNVQIGANNVLNGSDILTVRGVFTESVYVINGDSGYTYTPLHRNRIGERRLSQQRPATRRRRPPGSAR